MSNPGDHGSWNPQGNDDAQQPAQDPWAHPPADQQQYGQQDPYGQQGAGQDPFAPSSGASASDPYGQGQQSWSPAGSGPSASDPYGQGATEPQYGADYGAQGGGYGAPGAGPAPAGPAPAGAAPSRLVVGLLGIFLGGFGVHRFLLGYTTIGILQIVVTVLTCGLGAWWGVIEGIMVLAKAQAFERDAHGRPLTD